ncbi:hypothetical protein HDA32_003362 [Spinactinospora alkalitolerans]|uniref:ANTAR domain-containing protein n=1 Tax=Spinactinospora alkalitolerans TaxID=687207 RepID=A0A852TZ03_9ACTN|nr:GAF and ANTAR domain-containing protein [Spinactinospora alkalitolerans]NYE48242.1 hypothetical protein [Spinactinospora alkalitolerans]
MNDAQHEELTALFAGISRTLLAQDSVQDVLEEIVRLAVQTVEGCEDAGVLLLERKHGFETPAASSELVRESDKAQFEFDEGPCLDAAREERSFLVADMAQETRWPRYRSRALELGVGSMMGFELFTRKGSFGALDLYSRTANAFDTHSRDIGWVFASHAALALAGAQESADLRTAVQTRQEIGEAVGILVERHRISSTQAFDRLKKVSMDRNIKLREVARHVTYTGEMP